MTVCKLQLQQVLLEREGKERELKERQRKLLAFLSGVYGGLGDVKLKDLDLEGLFGGSGGGASSNKGEGSRVS